jgi:NADH dehydrogenase FAD-containing subunit
MLEEVGVGFSPNHLKLIVDRLIKKGVNLITETRVTAVEKDGSVQVETKDKKHTLTPYLAVVVASGYHSNSISLPKLDKKAGVDVIGDALQPRSIAEAVLEGVNSAINIRSDKEVTT